MIPYQLLRLLGQGPGPPGRVERPRQDIHHGNEMTVKMGPNDVSCISWVNGKFFLYTY